MSIQCPITNCLLITDISVPEPYFILDVLVSSLVGPPIPYYASFFTSFRHALPNTTLSEDKK